jgi:hypothetical protein
LGLRVRLSGIGRVTSITPAAGVAVTRGSEVTVEAKPQ